ncbi:MAG TPA: TetR family transcriptional regulator [Mycobacteriales bacterium]|nr:TetR family transcriptional regulator [Mycobacteriales bacterium]
MRPVGRWQPGAAGRLQRAAMELFVERGYDQTTVAEIAERAELTERTFFRYYADKREVLFAGSSLLQDALVAALREADEGLPPIEQVVVALEAAGELFIDRHHARRRHVVISAHAELRERELLKMAALSAALADGLRARGVSEPTATLSAEAGVAVFKVAFERWIAPKETRDFRALMRESLGDLRVATAR